MHTIQMMYSNNLQVLLKLALTCLLAISSYDCLGADSLRPDRKSPEQIKAQYIHSLSRFVKWPETERQKIFLCLPKKSLNSSELAQLDGKTVAGRSLTLLAMDQNPSQCDIAYFPNSETFESNLLSTSKTLLTIGDGEEFCKQGGIISFVRKGSKIDFRINQKAAIKNNIKFSASLMALSKRRLCE